MVNVKLMAKICLSILLGSHAAIDAMQGEKHTLAPGEETESVKRARLEPEIAPSVQARRLLQTIRSTPPMETSIPQTFAALLNQTSELLRFCIAHHGKIEPELYQKLLDKFVALEYIITSTQVAHLAQSTVLYDHPSEIFFRPIDPAPPSGMEPTLLTHTYPIPQASFYNTTSSRPSQPSPDPTVSETLPDVAILLTDDDESKSTALFNSSPRVPLMSDWQHKARWDFVPHPEGKTLRFREATRDLIKRIISSPLPDGQPEWDTELVQQELKRKGLSPNPETLARFLAWQKKELELSRAPMKLTRSKLRGIMNQAT